jgi:hypothetical protein
VLLLGPAHALAEYRLGQGLNLGPINIAGYSSITANFPDVERRNLSADDLSLFVSGHFDKLVNPFVEAEVTNFELANFGNGQKPTFDGYGLVERLYNDSYLSDGLTLRLGKMLSPVGQWNLIHAAPLVLATVRPAVTFMNFSEYTTGAELLYTDPRGKLPDIDIYWQPTEELLPRPKSLAPVMYREIEGFHVSLPLSLLDSVGVSFQHNRTRSGQGQTLVGADIHYTLPGLVLQSEWTYAELAPDPARRQRETQWGGYLGVSHPFDDQWSIYGWWETFAAQKSAATAHDLLIGGAWRPQPAMVFKLEYLQNVGGPPINPTGIFASWSILF